MTKFICLEFIKPIKKGDIILVEKALAQTKKEHRNPDSKQVNDMALKELENKCRDQLDLKGI